MRYKLLFPIIGLCLAALSLTVWSGWKDERQALDRRQTFGPFRVHYATHGDDAFGEGPGGTLRAEMVESMIARLGGQLTGADRYYSGGMGLVRPFDSPRYRKELRAIDVHLLRMDGQKGSTGDAPTTFRYRYFGDPLPALTITLSTRWRPPNRTPEHEVFHAYQYGYTYFKNAWYLEGMARAMEPAFDKREYRSETLPADPAGLERLLRRSYDAAPFWNRLRQLCDAACTVDWTSTNHYRPKDGAACGDGLVKAVLEEFQSADREAARARGIDPVDWPEAEQRSPANHPWMLRGLARAVDRACPGGNPELARFRGML